MPVYKNRCSCLFVEAREPDSLDLLLAMLQVIADRCQKGNLRNVIVDLTQMEGNPGILERYTIGVEVARICGARIECVAIVQQSMINHMMENVAVNRGAKLKVVSTRDEAVAWLKLETSPTSMNSSG